MAGSQYTSRAVLLATLMAISVIAGGVGFAGASTWTDSTASSASASTLQAASVQNGSAKAMTISWFRDDGDANGPYPVPPNEYDGNESPGIQMIANAKGDAHIRVDNSTARNPNGKWDMLTLNVETSGLEELNPPEDGWNQGLVTQEFLDNDNWNVEISQVGGDKTLDIAANQEGFEPPQLERGTEHDIPPVMIFADTKEIMTDYLMDGDPETSLYVWVDPNRAVLDENGENTGFEPGETYEATFTIHGQTETVTFEMVDGQAVVPDDLSAPNSGNSEVTVESTLAAGTEVEMILQTADGENQSVETEVKGNRVLGNAENPGTVPRGTISGTFDLSGKEGETFDVYVYAEDDRGGDFDVLAGSGTGTVEDVIDPNYTIENATIRDSKSMTIAYTNPDHDTPEGIGTQIGDGHASGDASIAKNVDAEPPYFDEMWVHYETSTEIFEAIERSPGSSQVEKFLNSPLSLEVRQTNADGEPKVLNLSRNASGVFVVPDNGSSDSRIYNSSEETGIFFSFKLNDMVFFQGGEPTEPEVGDEFAATLTIDTAAGVREETTTFRFVEGQTEIQHSGDSIELVQSESQEITINSTMARGTAMGIRLVAEGQDYDEQSGELGLEGQGPVICCDGPGTQPWGSTSASFDTTGLPVGTEITVQALIVADLPGEYGDQIVVDEVQGQIAEPASGSISLSGQSGSGTTVTVDSVQSSDGGFVAVRTGSPSGPTIGASSYLSSGEHPDVEIQLDEPLESSTDVYVVLHQDTNGNEAFDFPVDDDAYTSDGSPVSASATYTVSTPTATPTPTPTPTASPTPTPTATPTDEEPVPDDTPTATETDGQPGFGLVLAIVALLAAAGLLIRRE